MPHRDEVTPPTTWCALWFQLTEKPAPRILVLTLGVPVVQVDKG